MHNILSFLLEHIIDCVQQNFPTFSEYNKLKVEVPNDKKHGDAATNAALIISKSLNISAQQAASLLIDALTQLEYIKDAHLAGVGFINIRLTDKFWQSFLKNTYELNCSYGLEKAMHSRRINLEFVSVNPTGPMHIGHARSAIYGSAISNILIALGHDVVREYYINDAGSQVDKLVTSVKIRHQNLLGADLEVPQGCYPGEYLIPIATLARERFGDDLEQIPQRELADFVISEIMKLIKKDLADLGVVYDLFVSEFHDVNTQERFKAVFDLLHKKQLLYHGTLAAPKSGNNPDWEAKEQLIFRSTQFGDDSDRPIVKSDGSYTYFLSDILYHYYKLERGFTEMLLLLGADHGGYVKRIKAAVMALSANKAKITIEISQLVNLCQNGQPLKMSKRAGNFITVQDVIAEVGCDAFKFAILTRKSDTALDIDFAKLKEQSKDNPVFYVQYAHTRASSVLRRAQESGVSLESISDLDIQRGIYQEDMDLVHTIAVFPRIVQAAAQYYEPHRINYYAQELANQFHQLWAAGVANPERRFIHEHDLSVTKGRLLLVTVVRNTLNTSLRLLGIEPMDEM